MKRYLRIYLFISLLILLCSKPALTPLAPEDEFERAREFFEHKKYDMAIKAFERIIFYHATSEFVDDAQFYLARTYFEKKDYAQAITEFEYLIKNFPNTPFLEPSYFLKAKAYFLKSPSYEKDQTETKDAIAALEDFITRFPNSPYNDSARILILQGRSRLAKKELENGRLYLKMKEYPAAVLYFKYVIENYPETPFADEAQYLLGLSYEKLGKKQEAQEIYTKLLENQVWKKRAEKRIRSLGVEKP
ncbi:MAG: outer membrane protein assembly factor BamD [candidate division WOR-3 bacterium]